MLSWHTPVLLLPAAVLLCYSYVLYVRQLKGERQHAEELAATHMRMVEALAMAIEAKDQTTHDHLQRVRLYCLEIGKELKLNEDEMQALAVASLLHDIGKLAVPEYIISKPGKLTAEEFEKVKIHPAVGAQILERVGFPFPVAPMVKAHHERWDGGGYPLGLRGEQIPIGARILSAVDYLDALASDRQYRRGLPVPEVLEKLTEQSGKALDPAVVGILRRRFAELERKAQHEAMYKNAPPATEQEESVGKHQPATGLAWEKPGQRSEEVLDLILAARQEAQALFELSRDLGASLNLSETLSVLGVKLKSLLPYDAIAVYVVRGEKLSAEYVSGEDFRLLAALQIPIGEGVCGWVAQNGKMILNGNPSVEPGHPEDAMKGTKLKSALAVPLQGLQGAIGVLALYRLQASGFTSDDLRVLLAVSSKTGLALENALKYQQAESSATVDYLTGLPNARAMFLQLDRELARCERENGQVTVIVCDLVGLKKINNQFGHQEGNRLLKVFAEKLQATCRKYDHIARLGGDAFVIVAPDLPSDVAGAKVVQLRDLARQVTMDICGEDIVTLAVGQAVYPDDGGDAETVLEKADRRMYEAKQKGAQHQDLRQARRVKCCVPVEVQDEKGVPTVGTLVNISRGGCYVETGIFLATGAKIQLGVWQDGGNVQLEGIVVRARPGAGIAVEFLVPTREMRENINKLLQTIQIRAQEFGPEQRYLATTKALGHGE